MGSSDIPRQKWEDATAVNAFSHYGKLHSHNAIASSLPEPVNKCIPIITAPNAPEQRSSRRRVVIIGFLCLLLVAVICSAIVVPITLKNNSSNKSSSSDNGPGMITTLCNTTRYPQVCMDTLQSENSTDLSITHSKDVVQKAVKYAAYSVADMKTTATNLSFTETNTTILSALKDCQEVLEDALEMLNETLQDMTSLDLVVSLPEQLDNLVTFMSAALTDHTTCIDGFDDVVNGTVKDQLSEVGSSVNQLLSNALSLVNGFTTAGDNLSKWKDLLHGRGLRERQLHETAEGIPNWMTMSIRRYLASSPYKVDVVVAADGTGKYRSIQKAIDEAPEKSDTRYVIHIKKGTYRGQLEVPKSKRNLVFVGDGIGLTILTGNRNVQMEGVTTFLSATLIIKGAGFIGKDFTVRNTAGREKHQAVAMRVSADKVAFWRCSFEAYQDTLYAHSLRQLYYACTVRGTVDFIFGNGAAVFQNCDLRARLPMFGQQNTFTAQGRTDPSQNTGLIFHNCSLDGEKNLLASSSVHTYMGRPWKEYSRTVFLRSYLGKVVDPEGWLIWLGDWALRTCYYAEYQSWGPGASPKTRVWWSKQIWRADDTRNYSPAKFLGGNSWLPETRLPTPSTIYY